MPKVTDIKNELAERVKGLRELLARREAQGCAFPILEALRKELRDAQYQLDNFEVMRR